LNDIQSGINSLEEINLGGCKQWILIRGENVENPVLLFLHGGPGFPEMPFTHIDSGLLEKHLIVVNWDQRGAGKSYNEDIPKESLNIAQFLSDTRELIQLLKTRFDKRRIFLLGHSWGSVLGLYTAHRHPEDLYAYIGMGQVINMMDGETSSYEYAFQRAEEANDKESQQLLLKIGRPPFKGGIEDLHIQRMVLAKYGGSFRKVSYAGLEELRNGSPFYNERDKNNFMSGYLFSITSLWDELMQVDFFADIKEIRIPVYFFAGKYDYSAPFELLKIYEKKLEAPYKEITWFLESGHWPNIEEPQVFQETIIKIILSETKRGKS
jgi:pimeloyl-ACP methyl ester carboxylesterase